MSKEFLEKIENIRNEAKDKSEYIRQITKLTGDESDVEIELIYYKCLCVMLANRLNNIIQTK